MQETSLLAREPQLLSFSEFLEALIAAFDKEEMRLCVLRNYEGFPARNIGRDVDFLILPSKLPRAIRALHSIERIRMVCYAERRYVASAFLSGVSSAPGTRAIQVDFDLSLTWKGLPYLSADAVLEAAIPRAAGNRTFFIPSPVHEAIISLFASLLVGGWLKEKYFPDVRRTFASQRYDVIATLKPRLGLKSATRLVDSVIDGDRKKVLGCVRSLRFSLILHNLLRRPLGCIFAIVRHYASELAFRYSSKTLQTVCIVSPAGCDKTAIIDFLMPMLQLSAVLVERRNFGAKLSFSPETREMNPYVDPHMQVQGRLFVPMLKVIRCLLREWMRRFRAKKNPTLCICEGSCHDQLHKFHRSGHGGPRLFARIVSEFFPSPHLWVLLDVSVDAMQSGNQQPALPETLREIESYRSFVKTRKSHVILDANKPAASVAEDVYAAIIATLALRTNDKLKDRF